jgi:D-glycero-alpha-D-manno-heptose 1-phosphate guanylyltransferase
MAQHSVAIILAGGLGTRLKDAVPDLPKCLAPVNGKPFLVYIIHHLTSQGVTHFIFSLGYLADAVKRFLVEFFANRTETWDCVVETEPLGTGGALFMSLSSISNDYQGLTFVTNGDTLFRGSLSEMTSMFEESNADLVLAIKPMVNFDRYGVVDLDDNNRVVSFKEKQYYASGNINAGLYVINHKSMLLILGDKPSKWSFETDYMEQQVNSKIYGCVQNVYFIDIGVPMDFKKASIDLQ